ncbi:DUF2325 domain-containing protein [Variovorax sp. GT1P44]|uniref:DUF2325 domain-containing protein n=1 Tax=Variovorax sp. GT1P44 TaxID=3443742 RepID=UPI003F477DA0
MLNPPFKLAVPLSGESTDLCEEAPPQGGRTRLAQLDSHLHCSVIGTCLSTAELRKLMARFVEVAGASDLDIHHDAVHLVSHNGLVAKALHKALDHRHEAAVRSFGRAHDAAVLAALWEEALQRGEVPGAYWAVLTHRDVTATLRQKVFGDVHMLSHLVGAANRADIRRLVALERENADLRERLERQQIRSRELVEGREDAMAQLRAQLLAAEARAASVDGCSSDAVSRQARQEDAAEAAAQVALQTARRERAEQAAAAAESETSALREELAYLKEKARLLNHELSAAELQLRETDGEETAQGTNLDRELRARRILYVGGRPSSTPAIRELVLRHGGEFQRHDGGMEDRKGLLASAISWADLVVFPVDCVDHDSVCNLKRLCARQNVRFVPLRSAGVATFVAAFSGPAEEAQPTPHAMCRHR